MTTAAELIEFHEIEQLKYRYIRALDTQDWDLLEACFTPDAHAWYSNGEFVHDGASQIRQFLEELCSPAFVSSHIVAHPELKLTSSDTAEGIWRLQDIVFFTEPNPAFAHGNIQGGERMDGAGYYYDEYRKDEGAWRISSIGYVRIFEQIARRAALEGIDVSVEPSRGMRSGG